MAGIVEKLQKMWNPPDDEYDEYYEDEATEPTADSREERPSARRSFSSSSSNRVVNINHARAGAQVVVFTFAIFTFSFDIPYFFLCILPNILQNNFLNSENPVVRKEKVRNVSHFRCALSGFYSLFPCFCLISQQ